MRLIADLDSRISLTGLKRGIWAKDAHRPYRGAALAGLHLRHPEADEPPAGAQEREALPEAAPAERVEGEVEGLFLAGDPAYLVDDVAGAVVHGLIDAEAAEGRVLRGRGRAPTSAPVGFAI